MRTLEAAARRLKPPLVYGRLKPPLAYGRLTPGPRLPRLWLVTDAARLPDPLAAAARLPAGSGVLARDLAPGMLARLAALARQRRLVLVVAGDGRRALALGAGLHVPDRRPAGGVLAFLLGRRAWRGAGRPLLLVAAHGRAGLGRARRLGADAVLLSPVFATASHPGGVVLGPARFAALAARAGRPVLALGGVTGRSAGRLPCRTAGLAAIGGFLAGPPATAMLQPCNLG